MPSGKALWTGTFSSFRPAWSLLLNVDMANKPGYEQGSVLAFCDKFLNSIRGSFDNKRSANQLGLELKSLKIRFERPDGQKRDYRANGLGPPANKPNVVDKDGKRMSVQQYFVMEYKYQLRQP